MSIQDLIFACIEQGSFNGFDGPETVQRLRSRPELWEAVMFSDEQEGALTLRDMPKHMHVSALYIRSSGKDDAALESLLSSLGADEVDWVTEGEWWVHNHGNQKLRGARVLRAWWD